MDDLRELVEGALSPTTLNTYVVMLRKIERDQGAIPDTDKELAEFLVRRFREGASPGYLRNIRDAISFDARRKGKPSPAGPRTRARLTQFSREGRGRGRGQAKGVQWPQAEAAATLATAEGTINGTRDSAIISLMSNAMLRCCELVAIQMEDVIFEEDASARLLIRSSKTDQEGVGGVLFLGKPTALRVSQWLRESGITEGPIFRRFYGIYGNSVGRRPLSAGHVPGILKARFEPLGIHGVTGHSLRVGSAQSLAAGGATLVEMMIEGRWKSPTMPAHYARQQIAGKGAMARLRYGQQ